MRDQARYDYTPVTEREYDLPNDANVAVWIAPNVEYFKIDVPSTAIYPDAAEFQPDVLNHGWRDYGARVGIWRLLDVLDAHDVTPTVSLNAEVCDHQPAVVEGLVEAGAEFMCHGQSNSQLHVGMEYEEERALIEAARDRIAEATGTEPRGWLAPALAESYNTPDILAELGFDYICDWCNDDQPYEFDVADGDLLSVPYSLELNDFEAFLEFGYTPAQFGQIIKDEFDVLYEEGQEPGNGKVLCLALHPFISGQPFRRKYLDDVLEYITGHDDVWLTTGGEIADHYIEHYR